MLALGRSIVCFTTEPAANTAAHADRMDEDTATAVYPSACDGL